MQRIDWPTWVVLAVILGAFWSLVWSGYMTDYARECHARGGEPSIPNRVCYVTHTTKIMQQ